MKDKEKIQRKVWSILSEIHEVNVVKKEEVIRLRFTDIQNIGSTKIIMYLEMLEKKDALKVIQKNYPGSYVERAVSLAASQGIIDSNEYVVSVDIKIQEPCFSKIYSKYKREFSEEEELNNVIKPGTVQYSESANSITALDLKKSMPVDAYNRSKYSTGLCREMFKADYPLGKPVKWIDIQNTILEDRNIEVTFKKVSDSINGINKNFREYFDTDNDLFEAKKEQITRLL